MREIAKLVMGLCLLGIGVVDWRKKRIPMWMLGSLGILSILFRIFVSEVTWKSSIAGLAVGGLMLLIGLCTRQAIGYGDGWMIFLLGFCLGLKDILILVFVAASSAGLCGLILGICRGKIQNQSLPFAPFLALGYGVVMLC